jgi:hypothetical protein
MCPPFLATPPAKIQIGGELEQGGACFNDESSVTTQTAAFRSTQPTTRHTRLTECFFLFPHPPLLLIFIIKFFLIYLLRYLVVFEDETVMLDRLLSRSNIPRLCLFMLS